MKYFLKRYIAPLLIISGLFFSWGFVAGKKGIFPHNLLLESRHAVLRSVSPDTSWMQLAFTEKLHSDALLYKAIKSPGSIKSILGNYLIRNDNLFKFRQSVRLDKLQLDQGIAKLPFNLSDKEYNAYAYFKPVSRTDQNTRCAVVIVPPHRDHGSLRIARQEKGFVTDVPEGIIGRMTQYCDAYAVIKPNHGYLSIHDGEKRLRFKYLQEVAQFNFPRATTIGYFIASTAAFVKLLTGKYEKVFLMGLSEGSIVSQFAATLAEPNFAIMASGFSLLWSKVISEEGNLYAVSLDHHVFHLHEFEKFVEHSKTKFIYAFGKKEIGVLGVEAKTNYTCNYLSKFSNVECLIHDGGHIFPVAKIEEFVKMELSAR